MPLRFIEFIKVDGKQVSVDIVQISLEEDSRCFHIAAHSDRDYQFVMCKDRKDIWKLIAQEFPEFIVATLFKPISLSIEKRLMLEDDYLAFN